MVCISKHVFWCQVLIMWCQPARRLHVMFVCLCQPWGGRCRVGWDVNRYGRSCWDSHLPDASILHATLYQLVIGGGVLWSVQWFFSWACTPNRYVLQKSNSWTIPKMSRMSVSSKALLLKQISEVLSRHVSFLGLKTDKIPTCLARECTSRSKFHLSLPRGLPVEASRLIIGSSLRRSQVCATSTATVNRGTVSYAAICSMRQQMHFDGWEVLGKVQCMTEQIICKQEEQRAPFLSFDITWQKKARAKCDGRIQKNSCNCNIKLLCLREALMPNLHTSQNASQCIYNSHFWCENSPPAILK